MGMARQGTAWNGGDQRLETGTSTRAFPRIGADTRNKAMIASQIQKLYGQRQSEGEEDQSTEFVGHVKMVRSLGAQRLAYPPTPASKCYQLATIEGTALLAQDEAISQRHRASQYAFLHAAPSPTCC